MAKTETDLRKLDPQVVRSLLSLTDQETEVQQLSKRVNQEAEESQEWQRCLLPECPEFELWEKFQRVRTGAGMLLWFVGVGGPKRATEGPLLLRYGITAQELGRSWSSERRSKSRLRALAKAQLLLDLGFLKDGRRPHAMTGIVLIDRRGWIAATWSSDRVQ